MKFAIIRKFQGTDEPETLKEFADFKFAKKFLQELIVSYKDMNIQFIEGNIDFVFTDDYKDENFSFTIKIDNMINVIYELKIID